MDLRNNYFELFGLPEAFDIDLAQLSSRYRELQRAFHPDKFANAPDQERRIALQQAAHVNSGYQVLKDPLSRGRYLLELSAAGFDNETATIADLEFLEEQMELREALEDIRGGSDPLPVLEAFMARLDDMFKDFAASLAADLAKKDDGGALSRATETVKKMQFVRKLQEEALSLEEKLI